MKKLIAVTMLGLSLGFPALSSASDYMELYTASPAAHEVKTETKGGEVESSPMSFYLSPVKAHGHNDTLRTAEGAYDENALLIFGVRI